MNLQGNSMPIPGTSYRDRVIPELYQDTNYFINPRKLSLLVSNRAEE
jgi:hypothetical protein